MRPRDGQLDVTGTSLSPALRTITAQAAVLLAEINAIPLEMEQ